MTSLSLILKRFVQLYSVDWASQKCVANLLVYLYFGQVLCWFPTIDHTTPLLPTFLDLTMCHSPNHSLKSALLIYAADYSLAKSPLAIHPFFNLKSPEWNTPEKLTLNSRTRVRGAESCKTCGNCGKPPAPPSIYRAVCIAAQISSHPGELHSYQLTLTLNQSQS
jgi:hypothetical protein